MLLNQPTNVCEWLKLQTMQGSLCHQRMNESKVENVTLSGHEDIDADIFCFVWL